MKIKKVDEIEAIFGKDHETYEKIAKSPISTNDTPAPSPTKSEAGRISPPSPMFEEGESDDSQLLINDEPGTSLNVKSFRNPTGLKREVLF